MTLFRKAIACGSAAFIAACSQSEPSPTEPNPVPVDAIAIERGGMGTITAAELAVLHGLDWPQTYDDMVGTFGLASRSTGQADIYPVEGSAQEAWVSYEGRTATGFEIR